MVLGMGGTPVVKIKCPQNALWVSPKRTNAGRRGWAVWGMSKCPKAHSRFPEAALMSRRIRFAMIVLLTSFALGATACADISGPRADCGGGQGSQTCPE